MGMGSMTERMVAEDLLFSAKAAVEMYAKAITETATPSARRLLKRQLSDAILTHERISNYMLDKEYEFISPQTEIKKAGDTVYLRH